MGSCRPGGRVATSAITVFVPLGSALTVFVCLMWIVALALRRPYTFVVMALLIIILTPITILRTPVDIFPEINTPVVAVAWHRERALAIVGDGCVVVGERDLRGRPAVPRVLTREAQQQKEATASAQESLQIFTVISVGRTLISRISRRRRPGCNRSGMMSIS